MTGLYWKDISPISCPKVVNLMFDHHHPSTRWWQLKICFYSHPDFFGEIIQFDEHMFFKWVDHQPPIIGKMLVPLGWYPTCLPLQGALWNWIYPINTHYIRCIWGWLLGVPSQGYQHFPYEPTIIHHRHGRSSLPPKIAQELLLFGRLNLSPAQRLASFFRGVMALD